MPKLSIADRVFYKIRYVVVIFLAKIFIKNRKDISPYKNVSNVNRIVVYAYTGLGNYILMTPALKLLRDKYPRAHITLRHGSGTGCEKMTINSNIFNEYVEIKKDASLIEYALYAINNHNKYDVVISDFHNKYLNLALEISMLGAPIRLGHVSGGGWNSEFDFLYNMRDEIMPMMHETDMYLKLFSNLVGTDVVKQCQENTQVYLDKSGSIDLDQVLSESPMNIGFQIGTSPTQRWKQWPAAKFSTLLTLLRSKYSDCRIFLLGSAGEKEINNLVIEGTMLGNIYNLCGSYSILESALIVSKLDLMITNDSGLMHVANALKVPVVGIYGPTDVVRTSPRSSSSAVVRLDYDCMPCFKMSGNEDVLNCKYSYKCLNDITPEMVLNKIEELLDEHYQR